MQRKSLTLAVVVFAALLAVVLLVSPSLDAFTGLVRSILFRQWIVAGLFWGVVFAVLVWLFSLRLRASDILKAEVSKRTEQLQRSEAELRREHEQLKASMASLMETQERLIRSERFAAIGEAAAHLSHEIKNPLMLIGGFARQVLRSLPDDDPNVQKLQIIEDEIKRLEWMLNDVRDFTRPPKPRKEFCTLNECVLDTLDLMEGALTAQRIDCEKTLPERAPSVWYDPRQMKQVLINILKNAMDAMPNGGRITISSGWDREKIWLAIADTGMGMPETVCKKLFLPFFTTKRRGTGLGLAVCNKIIEDHLGEITVQSREGGGTQFTVFLPFGPDASRTGHDNSSETTPAHKEPLDRKGKESK